MNFGDFLFCVAFLVGGLLLMGLFIRFFLYRNYLKLEAQKAPWQEFARANNLEFIPGKFGRQTAHVVGDYIGRSLLLEVFDGGARTHLEKIPLPEHDLPGSANL